ncbi:MAG TPA: SHOCT domain-containing protein [Prolixibacteraceae bacterium]|nr:SHOCT domain-containing protein [Prolixibacteraceae bacterium]
MMNGMNNAWGFEMGLGWIIALIVLIVFIGLIAESGRRRKNAKNQKFNSPLDILKTRYAKGEISQNEFEEKRKQIS